MPRPWDSPVFTCHYSQPESYRFSLDSILLAKAVVRDAPKVLRDGCKVLDLCAGSGVIGFELSYLSPHCRILDFVEVQSAYLPHFEKNLREAAHLDPARIRWIETNYESLSKQEPFPQYDLIVCNPPYFEKNQGRLPPDELKARSRFFIDSDFATLWRAILRVLKPEGEAYVLTRSQEAHGRNREKEIKSLLRNQAQILRIEDLRGTWLYRIHKNDKN